MEDTSQMYEDMQSDSGNIPQANGKDSKINSTDQIDPDERVLEETLQEADDRVRTADADSPQILSEPTVDEIVIADTTSGETNRALSFPSEPVGSDDMSSEKVKSHLFVTSIHLSFTHKINSFFFSILW